MNQLSDTGPEALLQLARAGERQALGQLLELYRRYLGLLARQALGRRLQAKVDDSDLVQEVFLKAHQHFDQFRGTTEAELVGWLRQVLANTLADAVRRFHGRQRRDVRLKHELAGELDESSRALCKGLAASDTSPSNRAARREQAVLLADALERLPEHYRQVLILRHLEGCSFPEAAERMNRSLDSVEKLWARALARLRREVEAIDEPDRQQ